MKLATRRVLLRALFASGVSAAVAAALAPAVVASRRAAAPSGDGGTDNRAPGPTRTVREHDLDEVVFDEMYRGRRISGGRIHVAAAAAAEHEATTEHEAGSGPEPGARPRPGTAAHAAPGALQAHVDGRPLPLMRRADGGYLTMIDHYRSYPTPLAATRGAVDALGTALPARPRPRTD